ncbi:Glycosyltransferase involved in cell wall bisynthesis [Arthrobacter sp. ov407]|uniref:glycosyltransferase n=1 Tax=Arthrobacter sp. ov407 TaxID=1761748 RepID=UPI0008820631|nr:glycosyl transferase [Arthrobacter sp. ov407]SDL13878.1 Glycosyltransferase involved in cell wall bisynthesis [Arthrobacter sp. ov407]
MNSSLAVLQSFPVPRSTTNPYLVQLARGLRKLPGVTVVNFSWRVALLGKYDVFHVHWPEILVSGHSPLKKLVRQVLTLALLCRLALTKTPIVRTIHNIELPKDISVLEVLLLRLVDRRTTLYIRLNSETPLPTDRPSTIIPHGHYRDWFHDFPKTEKIPGRIGYVGLIRRYKGVEDLIQAFRETTKAHPELSLRLGGNPSTPELGEKIAALSRGDARIRLNLDYVSDAELVDTITSSELVVLPYRFMHNSGGALAALSLDRPVLVPANEVNQALSEEVGPGWVFQYTGALTPESILRTLASLAAQGPRTRPDLRRRDWHEGSLAHKEAYEQALAPDAGHATVLEKAVRP